jgi:hypothetical protein
MSLDAYITKAQAKKQFLKMDLDYYNSSDKAKEEYLKCLLKIQ